MMRKPLIGLLLLVVSGLAAPGNAADLPKGADSRFAQVNGIRMYYVRMGTGPLLILLHGWPQTRYEWHKIMPILASQFTVVAPDLCGFGLSEKTQSRYDKRTIAAKAGQLGSVIVRHRS